MSLQYFESEMKMPLGMVILPLRCTLIKTSKARILISPIALTTAHLQEMSGLGPITDIVAPSLLHHLHIKATQALFPQAQTWGPPGCREKFPEIRWDKILSLDSWAHAEEVETVLIEGIPRLNESVFLEKSSGTLITTDLTFNLTNPRGWAAPLVLRHLGTYGHFAVSKLILRFMQDQEALRNSLSRMMSWNFDSVVMAHGEIILSQGKEKLRKALGERGYQF